MADAKPPVRVDLDWDGELRFTVRAGDSTLILDSGAAAGPSPMQALAFALAGCMAIDVVHILTKGRHPLTGLSASLTGERADTEPRRFTRIALHFTAEGAVPPAAIERAIELSREKYCSVWNSLRQDIELVVTHQIA